MIISLIQVIIAILLVVLILVQERSSGMSGIFGGGDSGGFYQARRGLEKMAFFATIVLAVVFVGLALLQLFVKS